MDPPKESQYKVTVGVKQQQGFKYHAAGNLGEFIKEPLHCRNEDFYFPNFDHNIPSDLHGYDIIAPPSSNGDGNLDHQFYLQNSSQYGDLIFLMADGHAGYEAPMFFIRGILEAVLSLFNEQKWDFNDRVSNSILQDRISTIYSELDDEYTRIKTLEYQNWIKSGSEPSLKPCDDGCTMILNIIQPRTGWLLNCNVGDSRSVLAKAKYPDPNYFIHPNSVTSNYSSQHNVKSIFDDDENVGEDDDTFSNDYDRQSDDYDFLEERFDVIFASIDHNMTNPHKVYSIHQNGGRFLNSTGSIILYPRIEHPFKRIAKGGYPELSNSRLSRPLSDVVERVGCSHRRTLNLSGTLGDLLFKIHPPILVSTPDFSFIKLQPGVDHLLIMATDGIWDHLSVGDFMLQNDMVLQKAAELISTYRFKEEIGCANKRRMEMDETDLSASHQSSGSEATMSSRSRSCIPDKKPAISTRSYRSPITSSLLEKVCAKMVNREPCSGDEDGLDLLYSKKLMRYDDATMMIIHIEALQPSESVE